MRQHHSQGSLSAGGVIAMVEMMEFHFKDKGST